MEDQLLNYYERELTFIREMGAEFAAKYPKIAGRLLLEADACDDPHTERLIEAFALISGRIHKKIDDHLPEITESIFNIAYPHYTRPVPSMTVVKFEVIRQNISPAGYRIHAHTPLFSKPVKGGNCQFLTSQPVDLWPVEVTGADLREPIRRVRDAREVITIHLKTVNELGFSEIEWEGLRFFLHGQHQHVFHLYELIFNNVCHVEVEGQTVDGGTCRLPLPLEGIRPVGFDRNEAMLPYSERSFPGYLLLFEYFCFPEKFLFFDLQGLDALKKYQLTDTIALRFYLNRSAKSTLPIDRETFCLHTTPAVNLFQRIAEPIRLDRRKTEYLVIPDVRRQEATEVYSIDRVTSVSADGGGESVDYRPFYSIRHHIDVVEGRASRAFWHLTRRASEKKGDDGSDVFLSFADNNLKPTDPGAEIITVHTTCTNRNLPGRLPFGDPGGDFDLELPAPVGRISSLVKPTQTRRPFMSGGLQWRLISHLSLNYLSLVDGGEEALREMLRLYDFRDNPATRQQIDGIVGLSSRHTTRRIGRSFCRGVEATLTLDEEKFRGAGLFLFASVLEQFLGQYVSVNAFIQLVVKTIQREEVLKKWAPRSGSHILL